LLGSRLCERWNARSGRYAGQQLSSGAARGDFAGNGEILIGFLMGRGVEQPLAYQPRDWLPHPLGRSANVCLHTMSVFPLKETLMTSHIEILKSPVPWNKGRLIGQRAPLKLKGHSGQSKGWRQWRNRLLPVRLRSGTLRPAPRSSVCHAPATDEEVAALPWT
jgi:hypothetical protein